MQEYRKCTIETNGIEYVLKISWIKAILIGFDQLGNAFARGNPDSTISARIGYNNRPKSTKSKYWRVLEKIVDTTFEPIDDKGHCLQAYYMDENEDFTSYRIIGFISKVILAFLVVFFCALLFFAIRILVLIFPQIKSNYVPMDDRENFKKGFRKSRNEKRDILITNDIILSQMKKNLLGKE